MQITLWGVRGSLPAPIRNNEYKNKLRNILARAVEEGLSDPSRISSFIQNLPPDLQHIYGGDTTCVSLDNGGTPFPIILDAGTGLRPLGDRLMQDPAVRQGRAVLNFFITHTHWDHIQGLPFFKPLYIPGNRLVFHSPHTDLNERLEHQFHHKFFPVSLDQVGSSREFIRLKLGETLELGEGLHVDFLSLKHPGGSYAYRFKKGNRTFIFATDAEFTGENLERENKHFDTFFQDADLLIIDAQYTLDESFSRFDWGHTSFTMAVNCAVRWKVKNLVLTHHEPAYEDTHLYNNFLEALEHKKNMNSGYPSLFMAREGMRFSLR